MVKELLTILDNFERASGAIKTETDREKSINDSYQSVGKEMLKVLNKLGVEPIEPLGQEFDPNLHNAIQQVKRERVCVCVRARAWCPNLHNAIEQVRQLLYLVKNVSF